MIYFSPKKSNAQTLQDTLLSIDLNRYINKPIDSFLIHLPQTYESIKVCSGNTNTQGAQVVVFYTRNSDSLGFHIISVWPNTSNYIAVFNKLNLPAEQKWPLELLKRENVDYIEIIDRSGKIVKSSGD